MLIIYPLKSKLGYIVTLTIFLIAGNMLFVQNVKAFPMLPSSFYGTVQVDGVNIEPGTRIRALINDRVFSEGPVQMYEGDSVYSITVPGDDGDTTGVDGGREGDRIVFVIGNIQADQTGEWRSGTNVELNLSGSSSNQIGDLDNKSTPIQSPTLEEPEVEPTQVLQKTTQEVAPDVDSFNPRSTTTFQPTNLPLIDLQTPEPSLLPEVSSNTLMNANQQTLEGQTKTQQSSEESEENQASSQSISLTSTTLILAGMGFVLIAAWAIWAWMRWR